MKKKKIHWSVGGNLSSVSGNIWQCKRFSCSDRRKGRGNTYWGVCSDY